MFSFLNKKDPEIIQYLIGEVPKISDTERESLRMSIDFRKTIIKWCDVEIAKNTGSLTNINLDDKQIRQSQWFVNGILHVRNFLKNI